MDPIESSIWPAFEPGPNARLTGVHVNGLLSERKESERITVIVSVPDLYVLDSIMFPWYINPGSPSSS